MLISEKIIFENNFEFFISYFNSISSLLQLNKSNLSLKLIHYFIIFQL